MIFPVRSSRERQRQARSGPQRLIRKQPASIRRGCRWMSLRWS